MKIRIVSKILCVTTIFTALSSIGLAQSAKDKIVNAAISEQSENLEMSDYSSCLDMDKSTYMAKFKSHLSEYFSQEGMEEYLNELSSYGEDEEANAVFDAISYAEEELVSKSGKDIDEFYDCQSEKMQSKLLVERSKNREKMGDAITDLLSKTRVPEGSLDISLPLYKSRTMVSYFNQEQATAMTKSFDANFSGNSLQAVIYASDDDIEKIADFYEKKLEGFHKSTPYGHVVVFSAEPFDVTKVLQPGIMGKWSTIESVWIETLKEAIPQGNVKIELHFK